ncbi:MAG: hypothetical protein AAF437_14740 [Pseudomonadota bacterium]
MSEIDPNIPKLLNIRQKSEERRLAEVMTQKRALESKLLELDQEVTKLDSRDDGFTQLSIANGYLTYVQHRRETLIRQIQLLNEQADSIQKQLRKSLHSQSMLQNQQ